MARIPNIVHYCFGLNADFGFKPWSLVHYVSVRSAYERLRPEAIFLYYEFEPTGPWWDVTLPFITPVRVVAPRHIFGRALHQVQHRADVLRLEKLIEHGGIYLDADIVVLRDFEDLRSYDFVMAEEGIGGSHGLSNAVLLAVPNAPFTRRWYHEYHSFSDEHWTQHSVQLPKVLAKKHPSEITILPHTAFVWPLHYKDHLKWIFESDSSVDSTAYTRHLWESLSWGKYLENITPADVRRARTNFSAWAVPYLTDLPDNYGKKDQVAKLLEKTRALTGRLKKRFTRWSLKRS
jgi:hypothetical protein